MALPTPGNLQASNSSSASSGVTNGDNTLSFSGGGFDLTRLAKTSPGVVYGAMGLSFVALLLFMKGGK